MHYVPGAARRRAAPAVEEWTSGDAQRATPRLIRVERHAPRREQRGVIWSDDETHFDVGREADRNPVTAARVVHRGHDGEHVVVPRRRALRHVRANRGTEDAHRRERAEPGDLFDAVEEENSVHVPARVNADYPAGRSISMMPPCLLAALPRLPEELRYAFVGRDLILWDVHAGLIVDFVPRVIPETT